MTNAKTRKLEDYLQELRAGLRGLSQDQLSEIIEELRSHVRDCAESGGELTDAGVASALERLGPARELAAMYVTEIMMTQAEKSRSPWLIMKSIFRWATLSAAGGFVFLGSLVGYGLAAVFSICALMKPFAPDRAGLWKLSEDAYSLRLGLGNTPSTGTELLGWWIVPLGLFIGAGLFWLTARFGLWSIRRFRRAGPVGSHGNRKSQ